MVSQANTTCAPSYPFISSITLSNRSYSSLHSLFLLSVPLCLPGSDARTGPTSGWKRARPADLHVPDVTQHTRGAAKGGTYQLGSSFGVVPGRVWDKQFMFAPHLRPWRAMCRVGKRRVESDGWEESSGDVVGTMRCWMCEVYWVVVVVLFLYFLVHFWFVGSKQTWHSSR